MQWIIHQIDQVYKDGKLVPTTAHWRCTHSEGEFTGSVYSTASVEGLTDVSLDAVLAHIWAHGVDKVATEAACKSQIASNRASSLILNGAVNVPTLSTPVDKLKAAAYKCIDDWHQDSLLKLTGSPTPTEMATWDGKVSIATAIKTNTPLTQLQTEYLLKKGVTQDQYPAYAEAVMANAKAYWGLAGMADKVRSDCKNRINIATSEDAVNKATETNIAQCQAAFQAALKAIGS